MRSLKFINTAIAVILLLGQLLHSCSPSGTDTPDPNPTPTPTPTVPACKECEYYPVCNGSYFTYIDSIYPGAPVTYTDTIRALGDTTMGGLVFKKLQRISSRYPSIEYFSCKDGLYRVRGRYGWGQGTVVFLKPAEPVGATWNQVIPGGTSLNFTVKGKGMTMRINNTTYTDVIWMEIIIGGSGSTYTANYFHAKAVGNIKFEYGNWNVDPNWYHRNYQQAFYIP